MILPPAGTVYSRMSDGGPWVTLMAADTSAGLSLQPVVTVTTAGRFPPSGLGDAVRRSLSPSLEIVIHPASQAGRPTAPDSWLP